MSDVHGLSSEITLSRATTGTLVLKDGKGLGIKAGTYSKLKFLKLDIRILMYEITQSLAMLLFYYIKLFPKLPIRNRVKLLLRFFFKEGP